MERLKIKQSLTINRSDNRQQQNAPEGCGSVNQHVVAQEKVAMTNKCKATFMLPTVRILAISDYKSLQINKP